MLEPFPGLRAGDDIMAPEQFYVTLPARPKLGLTSGPVNTVFCLLGTEEHAFPLLL